MELIKLCDVNAKIISLRGQNVILDCDVATLYGVATRRVNEAVKNNPNKFPAGYILELQPSDTQDVVEKNDRFKNLKHSTVAPKAFTEKGLYMLATILKSDCATQTTLAIVEVFAKLRELSREVAELVKDRNNKAKQEEVAQKSRNILSDIIENDLETVDTETSYELNLLATVKIRHTVKRTHYEKR